MHWFERAIWKAGMLLLLVLIGWAPVSAVGAQEPPSGLATSVKETVQATPTVDLTVTALVKDQLQQQDDKLKRENSGLWPYWLTISGFVGSIFLAVAAVLSTLIGFRQWRGNQKDERVKRSEERFKSVVEGLGSESAETKIASAVLLRTFLGPDYGKFYTQVFDLAVANLQPQEHSEFAKLQPQEHSKSLGLQSSAFTKFAALLVMPKQRKKVSQNAQKSTTNLPNTPISREATKASIPKSQDSLKRAFITVFKEAFPLAREELKKQGSQFDPQLLDATHIQLDEAFLWNADLREAWMPEASLNGANLTAAMLSPIQLEEAHLEKALLKGANLSDANLRRADLNGADLESAVLIGADLNGADLRNAVLRGADLSGANFEGANLTEANLNKAILSETNLEETESLKGAYMYGVIGLSSSSKERSKYQGAIIEETSSSSTINNE